MPSRKPPKPATELSAKATPAHADLSPLIPKPYPEVVIGLVGPVGIDLEPIVDVLARRFEAVEYKASQIRLSAQIEKFFGVNHSELPEDERIEKLMDAGTRLREESERGEAVALLAIAEISRVRQQELNGSTQGNAYILRSLKHPDEVETLRAVYGKGFFLISAYAPRDVRVSAMAEKITRSQHGNPNRSREKAEFIVERDEQGSFRLSCGSCYAVARRLRRRYGDGQHRVVQAVAGRDEPVDGGTSGDVGARRARRCVPGTRGGGALRLP